jgi:pimeloyl-ACP methyl ester carboxylesterase
MTRLETAPTDFIETAGITFAYRRLGTPNGTPLVLLQHFTGDMDSWLFVNHVSLFLADRT